MDDLGFNKIAAAILATGLGVAILLKLPGLFMADDYPQQPLYSVGSFETVGPSEPEVELPFPEVDWVAAMDPERGAKVFKKCTSCHNVEDGGKNGTGPNLWNVVNATAGTHAGFSYSAPMASMAKAWSYEELDGFLKKPKDYLPGTKMNFVGLKKPADRAAVIEYLRLQADAPIALPTPAPIPTELAESAESSDVVVEPEARSMEQPTTDPSEMDGDNIAEPADTPADQKRISPELREDAD